ncbi:hypothetical protein NLJ89_g3928 [Agrocybe chaxingu]|uniref:Protein kinase domain-containing protein n=1 Tax=Agrocybe chaxingu TaxID=84603 RepID=A0A9W8K3N8_9AGAR|nr:hypothetical protein NLJ89_g3928 [Agrocybe chaxingu]
MEQLQLTCFYPAEEPHAMVIPIAKNALVVELWEEIHDKLKEWDPNFDVDECDLSLYKTDLPLEPDEDKSDRARRWILGHLNDQLDPLKQIGELFPSPLSPDILHIVIGDPELRHLSPLGLAYRRLIMTVSARGGVSAEDLKKNGIVEESNPHQRITEFQDMLQSTPRHEGMDLFKYAEKRLQSLIKKAPSDSPAQAGTTLDTNDGANPDPNDGIAPDRNPNTRECSPQEITHVDLMLVCDFSRMLGSGESGHELTANAAIFAPFACSLATHGGFQVGLGKTNWPFEIFIKTDNQLYSDLPRSDFQFSPATFPVFLAEVQSGAKTDDNNRMKLRAAALLRFANSRLKKHSKDKTFFLVTAYITWQGDLEQRIFYQDQQDKRVKYTQAKHFKFLNKASLLSFLCELYNLASWVAENASDEDIDNENYEIQQLNQEFGKVTVLKGWMNAMKTLRKAPDSGFEEEGRAPQRQRTGDPGDGGEFDEQLEAFGYQVEPRIFEDASGGIWELLGQQLPSTMRRVYTRSDFKKTNPLIAKRARQSSHELEILQYLRPSPYIITLVDSFVVGGATYLILPKLAPVIEDSLRKGKIKQPCRSLVAGVAHLHKHGVAHLDLKPDNLVYNASTGQLKIIDFAIAVRVENEEQEVEYRGGTEDWTAPEVVKGRRFSAIRADRWACGQILEIFVMHDIRSGKSFSDLAEQLMTMDPSQRPSLVDWYEAHLSLVS